MDPLLIALRASVDRLHVLASGLDDAQLSSPSFCDDWSVAQVLSHLGSGAVISRRGLEDVRSGTPTPEDFNPSVWAEWDGKSPRAQADDALVADEALMRTLEGVVDADRERLHFPMGPLQLGFDELVGLRLNEHALHTWDIAVVFDDAARLPADAAALIVDNLALIARFTGRPDGTERTIVVRTTAPERTLSLRLSAEGVELGVADVTAQSDLELSAEAFSRLVYGRLDPRHTPEGSGDPALLADLRAVFPGP
jgi:uncharacterized protein (TIGR03083 family)